MPSRQREWQIRTVAAGGCMICAKPRDGASRVYCLAHLEQNRRISRASYLRRKSRKEAAHAP